MPIRSEWSEAPLGCGWYMADPARVNEVQKSIREQIMCRTDVDPACDEACGDELDEPCRCRLLGFPSKNLGFC